MDWVAKPGVGKGRLLKKLRAEFCSQPLMALNPTISTAYFNHHVQKLAPAIPRLCNP